MQKGRGDSSKLQSPCYHRFCLFHGSEWRPKSGTTAYLSCPSSWASHQLPATWILPFVQCALPEGRSVTKHLSCERNCLFVANRMVCLVTIIFSKINIHTGKNVRAACSLMQSPAMSMLFLLQFTNVTNNSCCHTQIYSLYLHNAHTCYHFRPRYFLNNAWCSLDPPVWPRPRFENWPPELREYSMYAILSPPANVLDVVTDRLTPFVRPFAAAFRSVIRPTSSATSSTSSLRSAWIKINHLKKGSCRKFAQHRSPL